MKSGSPVVDAGSSGWKLGLAWRCQGGGSVLRRFHERRAHRETTQSVDPPAEQSSSHLLPGDPTHAGVRRLSDRRSEEW